MRARPAAQYRDELEAINSGEAPAPGGMNLTVNIDVDARGASSGEAQNIRKELDLFARFQLPELIARHLRDPMRRGLAIAFHPSNGHACSRGLTWSRKIPILFHSSPR